jgi:hypothetical protein
MGVDPMSVAIGGLASGLAYVGIEYWIDEKLS